VFLGAAPGVGKTFAILDEALRLAEEGADVLVGVLETHDRPKLVSRMGGLEVVPPREVSYRGISVKEMDLDLLLRTGGPRSLWLTSWHTRMRLVAGSRSAGRT
jgi:two-component system, OmpR family, sensor histidine kinase KdpD